MNPLSELPKYPGDEPAHAPPARPHTADTTGDRLRHAFPTIIMLAGAAAALVLVIGLAIVLVVRGVAAGWLYPLLMVAVFLALPAAAIGAAIFQRARMRNDRLDR